MADHPIEQDSAPITVPSHPPHPTPIVRNPDGSYTRFFSLPCTAATPDHNSSSPVLSKDIPINAQNKTWARVYLHREALDSAPSGRRRKLPLIVYFHGGGFIFISAGSTISHEFCEQLAGHVAAVVVSVDYRLAPEHRLPAAYEDAVEALHFIKNTQEKWITEHADLSNCFLMGTSAGGNISYNAGLRAASEVKNLIPLEIKGLILHHPFFGGSERTGSELRLADVSALTLKGSDFAWGLSLPVGADRDHEYCNAGMNDGSGQLGIVRAMNWRILVAGCFGDLLIDRQIELKKMLMNKGLRVIGHFYEGDHSMEVSEPLSLKAKDLFKFIEKFIY